MGEKRLANGTPFIGMGNETLSKGAEYRCGGQWADLGG